MNRSNTYFIKTVLALLLTVLAFNVTANVRRVTRTGTGSSGSGWTNAVAFGNLQQAIDSSAGGDTIWVKAGIYKPAPYGTSFNMKEGVVLLGGFNGTETIAAARNVTTNETVLQGNGYAVIYNNFTSASPMTTSSVLDGFTVTRGKNYGGMYNYYASPTVNNCLFLADTARRGGGMSNYYSSPFVTNSTFKRCYATLAGGGIYTDHSSGTFNNLIIDSNACYYVGGGIANWDTGAPTFTNIILSNNLIDNYYVDGGGGGFCNFFPEARPTLTNVVFLNNEAVTTAFGGGGYLDYQGHSTLINVTFAGNNSDYGGGAISSRYRASVNVSNAIFWNNNIPYSWASGPDIFNGWNSDGSDSGTVNATYSITQVSRAGTGNILGTASPFVDITNPKGPDNLWLTADDGLQLAFCSPALNTGNDTGVTATDILGHPRIAGSAVDMGAYEKQSDVTDFKSNAGLSNNNANSLSFLPVCDDGEWTFYADPTNPDNLSFGVSWGPANAAAKAGAQLKLVVAAANTAATTATDGIWAMRRYWNVTLATALSAPVKVRFYYDPADTLAMHTAANTWNTTGGGGLLTIGQIRWFKTTSGAYTPSVVTATDINGGNKVILEPVYGMDNGVAFVQFDTVTSFSGGTAALGGGAGVIALPLELISYTAQYSSNGAAVLNQWTVGKEEATGYEIERSTDGIYFETAGKEATTGNQHYSYTDPLPAALMGRQLYYRLAIRDVAGNKSYSAVARLAGNGSVPAARLRLTPNPVATTLNISGLPDAAQSATLTDLNGKRMLQFILEKEMAIDMSLWQPGIYVLRLSGGEVYRVVKK